MVPVDGEVAGVKLSATPALSEVVRRLQSLLLRRQHCALFVCRVRAHSREVQQDVEASCGLGMAPFK